MSNFEEQEPKVEVIHSVTRYATVRLRFLPHSYIRNIRRSQVIGTMYYLVLRTQKTWTHCLSASVLTWKLIPLSPYWLSRLTSEVRYYES